MSDAHPRNSYHFCPKCASKGHFNDEQHSFKCTACGFNFFLNAAAAVTALIFNSEGQLMMVRRAVEPAKGMLDFPGGFVDPGESAETAIVREVEEELSVTPINIRFYASFPNKYLFSGVIVDTVDLVFLCEISDFSMLKVNDDVASIEYFYPSDIDLASIPFESVKQLIKKLVSDKK